VGWEIMSKPEKDILIAYLPSQRDLYLAQSKRWYRIPVSSHNIPNMVKDGTVKMIAFYQPNSFKEDAQLIRYYGIVESINKVKRKVLLKDELLNPKSDDIYYKIKIDKLLRLPTPIRSLRSRRILFITTTLERFNSAREINDLFLESPLEEKFWIEFKKQGINAERQYYETIGKRNFILDFALFCRKRKIAVECDGDKYHSGKTEVQSDKRRDNILESRGWNVLRYTTKDIEYHFEESIGQVKETINHYGGLEDIYDPIKVKYFPKDEDEPNLFCLG
jgi:very-short-patch-repair endonuclease